MNPLVSCVVPVFDGERYLAEALDSILSQTYQPVEIIVVDDGSTDGTAQVVAGYGERIQYLFQENSGAPAARNRGIEAAQGEFVAFLDADDLWHKEKLARQMARFDARPELGICNTHQENFWIAELKEEEKRFRESGAASTVPGALSALVVRRTVFSEIGVLDGSLRHHDVMDWLGRAKEGQIAIEILSDTLVFRRLHFDNVSRNRGAAHDDEMLRAIKGKLDRWHGKTKTEE